MRFACKRDTSHRSIAEGLREVGAIVVEGFDCDLYVRFRDKAWLIECKTRELTERKRGGGLRKGAERPKQAALKEVFGSQYLVAFDLFEALLGIGAVRI